MKVYLFSDYLASIHGDKLDDSKIVAEIEPLKNFPDCLVEINGKLARVCGVDIVNFSICHIEWVEEPIGEDECHLEYEAKCPHCGNELRDSSELPDEHEQDCDACGTLYSITRDIDVTYSTKVIERNCEILSLNSHN